ncbi:C-_U-editing enzyme APOBEC-1 [Acomys russatus]|uniref:C->U-editing enzyme APOBEC-1 n=1 Tax=Acomys russatus TaxID=60746 RepID=UPI0021E265F8|nr:C->U-editing enzyme APOBEC-1 [Acomys russatus]
MIAILSPFPSQLLRKKLFSSEVEKRRRRIEPQEFEVIFDPRLLRKETCLLYEINWGGRNRVWRHTSQNTDKHVEINFIEKFTSERYFCPSTRCSIVWFMSWSPCGECSKAIAEFLSRFPNVTLHIYVARLYYHADQWNRQGLRDLISRGVTIQIMTERECCYCWRNFVNYPPSNEDHWPRYPHPWVRLYALELHCIALVSDFGFLIFDPIVIPEIGSCKNSSFVWCA